MENNNKGIGNWTFRILYKHYIDKFIACKTQQKCFYNEGQFLTSLMLVALYNVSFRDHLVIYIPLFYDVNYLYVHFNFNRISEPPNNKNKLITFFCRNLLKYTLSIYHIT